MNKKRIMLLAGTLITLIVICINLILAIKILPGSGYGRNQKKLEQARTFSIPSSGKRMQLEQEENNKNQEQIEIEEKEQELAKLKEMAERDRMEYYFNEFISYLKADDYSKAYDLLYPEFKEKYFKSFEDFKDYAKKTYPKSVAFSYKDIQRQGYIYVLLIDVIDPSKKVSEAKSQRIVIKENNFDDFVLSFQVI